MSKEVFKKVRKNIVGIDQQFPTPYGKQRIIYADWTASGRIYGPIEKRLAKDIFPWVGNTHTETTTTGSCMTKAYHEALQTIKQHVNAGPEDAILTSGSGMTGVVNKFQRILGLRLHEKYRDMVQLPEKERPIIFVTHMEHHSNQTSWLETVAELVVINPDDAGCVDLGHLQELLDQYKDRTTKIAAITSCSNVTGVFTPYHAIAGMMHRAGGVCFVDFACSAPYIEINMHPEDADERLDAIYFSPHKFLGGPGTSGVLIFHKSLYHNQIPDHPGGGTVMWTNPWGGHRYVEDIEAREDGGTPGFLQAIKTALCVKLKEEMGVANIRKREEKLLNYIWDEISTIPNLVILASNHRDRLAIISFCIDDLHFNLGVRLLNDRFGIQVRGGCSCAGTYGHYLLNLDEVKSRKMSTDVDSGYLYTRPGWIRLSIHPTTTDKEAKQIVKAIRQVAKHHQEWAKDYIYDSKSNEFHHKEALLEGIIEETVEHWFEASLV